MEVIISIVIFVIASCGVCIEMSKHKDIYGYNIRKGDNFFDIHEYQEALECYEYAIELDPKRPEAYLRIEECYPILKQLSLSKSLSEKFIAIDSSNICGYLLRMITNYDLKIFNNVIEDASKILELDKDNVKALEYKAKSYFAMEMYEKAAKYYKKLIKDSTAFDGNYYYYASISLSLSEKAEEAVPLAQKCINNSPNDVYGYAALMVAYNRLSDCEHVIETADKVLKIEPDYKMALNYKIHSCFHLKMYDQVISLADIILNKESDNLEIYRYEVYAYLYSGQYDNALDIINKAMKVNADNSLNLRAYAEVLIKLERFEEARVQINKAIDIDEKACNVFVLLAMINLHENNIDECYKNIEEAVKRNNGQLDKKLLDDKIFDSIRGQEKFKELINKI